MYCCDTQPVIIRSVRFCRTDFVIFLCFLIKETRIIRPMRQIFFNINSLFLIPATDNKVNPKFIKPTTTLSCSHNLENVYLKIHDLKDILN